MTLFRFNKLQEQKAAVLRRLESWSPQQLAFRPDAASWSALHVVSHLLKVEAAFVRRVKESLPEGQPITIKQRIAGRMVIAVMQSPLRVKVPAGAAAVLPEPSVNLAQLNAEWSTVRTNMRLLLDSIPPDRLHQGFFKHPVSGWMSIPMALTFLSAHFRHHEYQFRRLQDSHAGSRIANL